MMSGGSYRLLLPALVALQLPRPTCPYVISAHVGLRSARTHASPFFVPARVAGPPCCTQIAPSTATAPEITENGGRAHTAESRAKISAANKGRTPWNAGKQHTDETRQRIAEGTRLAYQRKVEAKQRERERLEREDPEAFAALLAEEAAAAEAKAVAAAAAAERRSARQREARRRAREEQQKLRDSSPQASKVRNVTAVRRGKRGPRVNFTFTAEARARISESLRQRWRDPEYRASRANVTLSAQTRKAISESMKEKWRDGHYRARVCVNGSHSAERRAKISAAIRAKWADADYRDRATKGIRAAHANSSRRGTQVKRVCPLSPAPLSTVARAPPYTTTLYCATPTLCMLTHAPYRP